MEKKTFYITTPIYYPSDKLHIGHSYCTVATDAMARYKRLTGHEVMFLTGTDEHGQKIENKAAEAGVTPQQFVDNIVEGEKGVKDLWKLMNISYDRFIRTTDDYHVESVQKIFKKMYEKGDIYKGSYKGKYCTPCESFWTESQLKDGCCPDCGRPCVDAEEEAYFFRLSKYAGRIRDLLENTDFLLPRSRVNEMVHNFIEPGLEDLCVSRTSFTWGIPVDFDSKHVVYVWIDALSNYITALGYLNGKYSDEDYAKFWPADVHFVGKEIVRFHSIIWPAMLMSMELPLPKHVYGHGWLLLDGGKMSKSKGNVVDPYLLAERYSADALRYFLLREIVFGNDGNFSRDALITRINSDLANDLGNLLHRTVSMIEKYHGGVVTNAGVSEDVDEDLQALVKTTVANFEKDMDAMEINSAIKGVWALISRANKYIDETGPWILAKDEAKAARLQTVMYNLAETLRVVAILVAPFIPSTSPKIYTQLGLEVPAEFLLTDAEFGKMESTKVQKGEPLYPRIEIAEDGATIIGGKRYEPKVEVPAPAVEEPKIEMEPIKEEITIDAFEKIDLRVGTVKAAEKVKKSKKLLKLQVMIGEEERTIVSGIAQYYEPEALIGRNVIVIANLAPAKLFGIESFGMLLAASDGNGNLVLADAPGMASGSRVK